MQNSYSDSDFSGRELRFVSIAVACGVAALIWLGSQFRPATAQQPPAVVVGINGQSRYHGLPNPMEANAVEHSTVLKRLAERSGGDYNRLSDDEKTWLDAVGGGMGSQILRNEVQILKTQRAKTQQRAAHVAHTGISAHP